MDLLEAVEQAGQQPVDGRLLEPALALETAASVSPRASAITM